MSACPEGRNESVFTALATAAHHGIAYVRPTSNGGVTTPRMYGPNWTYGKVGAVSNSWCRFNYNSIMQFIDSLVTEWVSVVIIL